MTSFALRIRAETSDDDETVEQLAADAFGPGRFARAAFRLREGVEHEHSLSFVALMARETVGGHEDGHEELVGSVRLTRILIGGKSALVLGPLIVARTRKNLGIGRELMHRALVKARGERHRLVILVGDYPYYAKFGFEKVPHGRITLPGPADPQRILYCELQAGALADYAGAATRYLQ
ncbi:MAG: N-acetyltransferase [Salaquimonas sp.]|jgi:predicted N-acetyltransferase YhbS|nr:N-acetyltransferase [Salaquimonas sp.]